MRVFRLTRAPFATLDGDGARRHGGRWTPAGRAAVYTSEHRSLALLEVLVHFDLPIELLPSDYVMLEIELPNRLAATAVTGPLPLEVDPVAIGQTWLAEGASAVLCVPSVIVPEERNFILNPAHPDAAEIAIHAGHPFALDRRLL